MTLLSMYAGRRVLVTGHTGFKGSWLCMWLHRLGARVSGLALEPPTTPSNFVASGVEALLEQHHIGDVRDLQTVQRVVTEVDPEIVLHLAAQPLVRESYATPVETFDANVMGTVHVLDAVRTANKPMAVVVITSDKAYRNDEHVWGYREHDPLGGHDPYSASKGAAEIVVNSYRASFFAPERVQQHGVRLASARAGNVVGGGDWAKDRLVTDIVAHLARGEAVPIRSPHAVRPWQHVLEPLAGYLELGARLATQDDARYLTAFNLGPLGAEARPVHELVDLFCAAWGDGRWEDVSDPNQLHEAHLLRLCVDRALSMLDWRPRWSAAETVARTASWFRAFAGDPAQAHQLCMNDIEAYEQAMRA